MFYVQSTLKILDFELMVLKVILLKPFMDLKLIQPISSYLKLKTDSYYEIYTLVEIFCLIHTKR